MFLLVYFILSTWGRGVGLCHRDDPLDRDSQGKRFPRQRPQGQRPKGQRPKGQIPQGQIPPYTEPQTAPPRKTYLYTYTFIMMATAVGGMHPTSTHYCL